MLELQRGLELGRRWELQEEAGRGRGWAVLPTGLESSATTMMPRLIGSTAPYGSAAMVGCQ